MVVSFLIHYYLHYLIIYNRISVAYSWTMGVEATALRLRWDSGISLTTSSVQVLVTIERWALLLESYTSGHRAMRWFAAPVRLFESPHPRTCWFSCISCSLMSFIDTTWWIWFSFPLLFDANTTGQWEIMFITIVSTFFTLQTVQ